MTELTKVLEDLQVELFKQLLERARSGEASASDFAVMAKVLKDNNVQVNPETNKQAQELEEKLKAQREKRLSKAERDEAASNVIDFSRGANG